MCPLCKGAEWLKRYKNGRDISGGSEVVPCECKTEELKYKTWERARRASGLYAALFDLTFANFNRDRQPEAIAAALAFVADPDRSWLVLAGDVGTGKTHILAAIVNRLLGTQRRPVYAILPELLRYLRQGFDAGDHEQRWRDIRDADVLLLDDYGAEAPSAWATETLFTLLDYRYATGKPLVLATNLKSDQMDGRIASRLRDRKRSQIVLMRAGDYRRSDARAAEAVDEWGDSLEAITFGEK